ncbi:MAG: hypothetical protein ACLGRW_08840 [Acidobacteriota bacterium]
MTSRRKMPGVVLAAIFLPFLLTATGCRSYHVDTTVENQTGSVIKLLEVDYPYASFGADSLADRADYHYRIAVQGAGPLKVQYTAADEKQEHITGPALAAGDEGSLQIVLLPGGKAKFFSHFTPHS